MSSRFQFPDFILFEDKDYIVINKPAGLSSLEDRKSGMSVLSLAREYHEDSQLCHRLDKETSGVLVIAKTADFYRHLAIRFEKREVRKIYHAIVDGSHDFTDLSSDAPLAVSSGGKGKVDLRRGKSALTLFNTGKAYRLHTLVECMPITGRTHQIRVHLAYMNHPIVSDNLYGGNPFLLSQLKRNYKLKKWEEEKSLIRRTALHAYSISYNDLTGKTIEIRAPYPKDFNVLVYHLEKYS